MGYMIYCQQCIEVGYKKALGSVCDDGSITVNYHQDKPADHPDWMKVRIYGAKMVLCEIHKSAGIVTANGITYTQGWIPVAEHGIMSPITEK